MTIKRKLLVLIGISCGGMAVAVLSTLFLYAPLEKMQQEQRVLFVLENSLVGLQSEITAFTVEPLEKQKTVIDTGYAETSARFTQLQELEALPAAGEEIALSLSTVEGLRASFDAELESFQQKYQEVVNDLALLKESPGSTIFELYAISAQMGESRNYRVLSADLNTLLNQIQLLNTSLGTVVDVMRGEFDSIDEQLLRVRRSIILTAGTLFLIIFVTSIFFALFLAWSISRNISHLYNKIKILGQGDLTVAVEIRGKDDLQRLGSHVNDFIGGLNKSVKEIKIAAEDTVQVKNKLLLTIENAQESSGSIRTSTESIGEQVGQLDGRIGESMVSVDTMASHSDGVLEMLQEQTAMVEESNASINEMISSIRNVAETADKRYAATARLTESSRRGSEKLIATTSLIEDVTEKVDDIREATGVIRNVAAQTSLLAMNAAIEAAHAGDKGAGFAVVAEEIRKLSDTTTGSSKRIGNFLNEVIDKIQLTSQVGEETKLVFEEVASVVEEVSSSLIEITESMRELNIGGGQILEATTKLQEFSVNLRERGQQMGAAAEDLTRTMDYTRTTSSVVLESVSHIGTDVGKINASMQSVSDLSRSLNEMTLRVEGAVKVFRTESTESTGLKEPIEPTQPAET